MTLHYVPKSIEWLSRMLTSYQIAHTHRYESPKYTRFCSLRFMYYFGKLKNVKKKDVWMVVTCILQFQCMKSVHRSKIPSSLVSAQTNPVYLNK